MSSSRPTSVVPCFAVLDAWVLNNEEDPTDLQCGTCPQIKVHLHPELRHETLLEWATSIRADAIARNLTSNSLAASSPLSDADRDPLLPLARQHYAGAWQVPMKAEWQAEGKSLAAKGHITQAVHYFKKVAILFYVYQDWNFLRAVAAIDMALPEDLRMARDIERCDSGRCEGAHDFSQDAIYLYCVGQVAMQLGDYSRASEMLSRAAQVMKFQGSSCPAQKFASVEAVRSYAELARARLQRKYEEALTAPG